MSSIKKTVLLVERRCFDWKIEKDKEHGWGDDFDPIQLYNVTLADVANNLSDNDCEVNGPVQIVSDFFSSKKSPSSGVYSGLLLRIWARENPQGRKFNFFIEVDNDIRQELGEFLHQPIFNVKGGVYSNDISCPLRFFAKVNLTDMKDNLHRIPEVDISSSKILQRNGEPMKLTVWFEVAMSWDNVTPKLDRICLSIFSSNLLEDEKTKDFTVLADGGEIKCHRMILASQSPVLSRMVSPNGMRESQTARVEMKDMSIQGLTYLIRYLYGMEIQVDDLTSEIALELFQASHKYELTELERNLQQLFLDKREEWFGVEVATKLQNYVKKLKHWDKLENNFLRIITGLSNGS